jgi:hypothetical protein
VINVLERKDQVLVNSFQDMLCKYRVFSRKQKVHATVKEAWVRKKENRYHSKVL